jgi:hypothetical protein
LRREHSHARPRHPHSLHRSLHRRFERTCCGSRKYLGSTCSS